MAAPAAADHHQLPARLTPLRDQPSSTVTPDVAVYRYRFAPASRYDAVDVLMQQVQDSNVTWSASTFRYLSASTAEVILSDGRRGGQRAYFYLWFSTPAAGHGTFTPGQAAAAEQRSRVRVWRRSRLQARNDGHGGGRPLHDEHGPRRAELSHRVRWHGLRRRGQPPQVRMERGTSAGSRSPERAR